MTGVNKLTVELVIDGVKRMVLQEIEIRTGMIYRMDLPLIDLSDYRKVEIRIETNKEKE